MTYCLMYLCTSFIFPLPWINKSGDKKDVLKRASDYFYKDILKKGYIEDGHLGNFNSGVFLAYTVGWLIVFLC